MTGDRQKSKRAPTSLAIYSSKLLHIGDFGAAPALLLYAMRLLRFGGRRNVIRWRIHTAYGESGKWRLEDIVEFAKWCREVGRYRTMDCIRASFQGGSDVGQ